MSEAEKNTLKLTPLDELKLAHQRREQAQEQYRNALVFCMKSEIGYTKMAKALNLSETAIRLYIKRHNLRDAL